MTLVSPERLTHAYRIALDALLTKRNAEGYWTGELSASALATATAVSALALIQQHTPPPHSHDHLITGGLGWLAAHQNADGGWGDTVKSISNISTTMLCRAAFHIRETTQQFRDCLQRTEIYLHQHCGQTPKEQAQAVRARYGKDHTFAVPILTTCALAGLVNWKEVRSLPFELACFPQSWLRFLRLPMVGHALPALIASGQAVYHHRPPRNPFVRLVRWLARRKSLRVLEAIQPSSGGFLDATPLTSFVTLSLASIGQAEHPVARTGVEFLVRSVRPDGSWPIDTNLATWVTTLSINALAAAGALDKLDRLPKLQEWLVRQQFKERHPSTGADAGGWGWTDLPGSVPDADDTSGALLALWHLDGATTDQPDTPAPAFAPSTHQAAQNILSPYTRLTGKQAARFCAGFGLRWLLDLQHRDGGWPTFCRGWGHVRFEQSGCDLTAHVLRACAAWSNHLPKQRYVRYFLAMPLADAAVVAMTLGMTYLAEEQRPDGSWLSLGFGNQHAPGDENPTYGTARVLAAYRDLDQMNTDPARRGVAWLVAAQNADGGWGGAAGVPSSIEETALAVEILLDAGPAAEAAANKGLAWLVREVEAGGLTNPTPIGMLFAKLWYFERLYPLIFTVAALGRAGLRWSGRRELASPETSP
jgi:squalene-hopene/tetraprenyl-beta-curcumene cyclase